MRPTDPSPDTAAAAASDLALVSEEDEDEGDFIVAPLDTDR